MHFPLRLALRPSLLLATALALVVTLLPAQPADAATQRITKGFFGMTDLNPESWPGAPIGGLRLWDSGVTWRQIETSRGVFDFSRLDSQVAQSRSHGARPLIVLGQTPRFHAQRPGLKGFYGEGANSMPTLTAWKTYVTKVVRRYGTRADYQVWNETNVAGFFAGTPAQMAQLTQVVSKVVNNNARSAKVVGPAFATRLTGQRKWMRDYFKVRVGGKPVAGWLDVVALHLYPLPGQGPEASMKQLESSQIWMRILGVRKPIWNTEVNYGIQIGGTGKARDIPIAKESAMVARTYLLNADGGVKKVFWYAWDLTGGLANTHLTFASGNTSPAGNAYKVVRSWMTGSRMLGCTRDGRGTYTCTLKYPGGVRRVYWNPSRTVTVRTATSTREWQNVQGVSRSVRGSKSLKVNFSPIMVRSAR